MAKLKEHISHITTVLSNGVPSDDFQFSDPQIYFILKVVRQKLLKQKIDKGKYIAPYNFQTIPCVKLTLSPIEDCECFTANCYSLQSNCILPKIIPSDKGLFVEGVYTVNSNMPNRLDLITLDTLRLSKYSKTMKEPKSWFISDNNRLFITGYDRLAAVKMRALFEDPLEVMMLDTSCACNDDGTPLCIDPYEMEFPLDGDLSKELWMMNYEELMKIAMVLPPDIKNNALAAYASLDKK